MPTRVIIHSVCVSLQPTLLKNAARILIYGGFFSRYVRNLSSSTQHIQINVQFRNLSQTADSYWWSLQSVRETGLKLIKHGQQT